MGYFLTSKHLGFRCWKEEDLPLAMAIWGDAEVTALIGGPFTAETVSARLAREITELKDRGIQYWPVFLLDGDRHAGCVGFRPYGKQERVYELGFHFRRAFWGQGLAAEAARAVISYGFGTLGAEALFAGHHPLNEASRRVLLKLGFIYAGTELYQPTGLMHPNYWLGKPSNKGNVAVT
jgi:RimJ/RimL family protein N-acetyltransferase